MLQKREGKREKKLLKILVVDDEQIVREAIQTNLTLRHGHDVWMASNGIEALRILHAEAFDLILLDFLMPAMNGLQTFMSIRHLVKCPVVLMTAYAETGCATEFAEMGGSGFLRKPLDFDKLNTQIEAFYFGREIER